MSFHTLAPFGLCAFVLEFPSSNNVLSMFCVSLFIINVAINQLGKTIKLTHSVYLRFVLRFLVFVEANRLIVRLVVI